MLFRSAPWFTVALGLSLLRPCPGAAAEAAPGEPARLGPVPGAPLPDAAPSANQRMASAIAGQLRQSGQLRHYSIDLVFRDGSAEVSGTVADQPQREEVLRIVQGVPGVERVVDRLTLAGSVTPAALSGSILPAQAPPRLPDPLPPPGASGFPPAPTPAPAPGGPPPVNTTPPPPPEATPIFQAPAPSPYSLNPPPMPPYSWPTYAPYNNFSRVAYPEAYPYRAWPFIGPVYPFPKVPLGWRSVKLEWKDGYWWFSKLGNKYDWWRLRYW